MACWLRSTFLGSPGCCWSPGCPSPRGLRVSQQLLFISQMLDFHRDVLGVPWLVVFARTSACLCFWGFGSKLSFRMEVQCVKASSILGPLTLRKVKKMACSCCWLCSRCFRGGGKLTHSISIILLVNRSRWSLASVFAKGNPTFTEIFKEQKFHWLSASATSCFLMEEV